MRNILRSINNSKGLTIIQVLVGSFVASIVALGVSTMLVNSKIQTRKIQLLNTLTEQKARIEYLLRDQTSFDQSMIGALNSAALFTTLRGATPTTELDYAGSAIKFVIYDSAGVAQYNMLGPTASGLTGNGLTEKGSPCSSFNGNANAGNDDCPISYRILIAADCNGPPTSCRDPQLKIVARMLFNPSSTSNGQLDHFRNLIPIANMSSNSIADTVVDGKYDAVVKRTASAISRSFQLSVSNGNSSSTTTGACPAAWAIHPTTVGGWTEDYDPHNLVVPNAGGTFTLSEGGYYSCTLKAPAFAVGGFSIRLKNNSTSAIVGIASSLAPRYTEATARLETSFNNGAGQIYEADIKCDSPFSLWDLGISKSPYAPTSPAYQLVVVTCSKMDTVF